MSGTKIAGDALISALSFAEHSCLQLMMRRWRGGALAVASRAWDKIRPLLAFRADGGVV